MVSKLTELIEAVLDASNFFPVVLVQKIILGSIEIIGNQELSQ